MNQPSNVSLFAFVHPVLGGLAFVIALLALNQGLKQRDERTKRVAAPSGNFKRHLKVGRIGIIASLLAGLVGLVTTVTLRSWAALGTWHGRLGVIAMVLFVLQWRSGHGVLDARPRLPQRHGLLGLGALGLAGLAILLGIELLP